MKLNPTVVYSGIGLLTTLVGLFVAVFGFAAAGFVEARALSYLLIFGCGSGFGAAISLLSTHMHDKAESGRFATNALENNGLLQQQFSTMKTSFTAMQQENRALQVQLRNSQIQQENDSGPAQLPESSQVLDFGDNERFDRVWDASKVRGE